MWWDSAAHWSRGASGRGLGQPPDTDDLQLPPGSKALTPRCSLSRSISAWPGPSLAPGRKVIADSQRSGVAKPSGMEMGRRAASAARCVAEA